MIKVGAKAIRHARSITLQLAEMAVPRELWAQMLTTITRLQPFGQVTGDVAGTVVGQQSRLVDDIGLIAS